ncbi:MAG: DNA-3-methyladenine glycosylase family protein [Nitrospiraceae bacterium]
MALLPATDRRAKRKPASHAAACRHLANADPVMRRIIARVGPCKLKRYSRYFVTLCDSIISQQLSGRVAEVIFERFAALYPRRRPTPQAVVRTPIPRLRTAGLSRQKATYLKDLAKGFLDGRIRVHRLVRQSNEDIIEALTTIRGIGRWTVEMFLMFSLNRLDVLPVDDLGIQKAIRRWYGFRRLPAAATMRKIGRPWHPYETVACWYLWRSLR